MSRKDLMNLFRSFRRRQRSRKKWHKQSRRALLMQPLEPRHLLATITVDTAADILDGDTSSLTALQGNPGGDSFVSFREAVIATNNTSGADTIQFDSSLNGTPIAIGISGSGDAAGDFNVRDDLTIQGNGSASTILHGSGLDRVLELQSAVITIDGVTIQGGNSIGHGGGIRSDDAVLTIQNSNITGNTALGHGGGVYGSTYSGSLTIENSTITGNTGGVGGGIHAYTYYGTVEIRSSVISGNSASQGGGVSASGSNGSVSIDNSTISDNDAGSKGGGVFNRSDFLTVQNNSLISGNATNSNGGGIYNQGTLTVQGSSQVTNNQAGYDYYGSGTIYGGRGGGIYGHSGQITIDNSTISSNTVGVGGFGAGISQKLAYPLTLNNATVSDNQSGGNAGGVFVRNATITNSTINNNAAIDDGGGIFVTGTVTVHDSDVSGNTASFGGGITNYYGHIEVYDSTISGNTASDSGGGIHTHAYYYYSGAATVELNRSVVSGNTATSGSGGGIYSYRDQVTVRDLSVIDDNHAERGGGIAVYSAPLAVEDSTVSNNTANGIEDSARGGGIDSYHSPVTITDSVILSNRADSENYDAWGGGVYAGGGGALGGAVEISGTTFDDNEVASEADAYGGGLYVSPQTVTTINSSTFANNDAVGQAGGHGEGGGLWSASSSVQISGTTFSDNTTTGEGGGIYSGGAATSLTLNSVTLTQNVADSDSDGAGRGGGVYTDGNLEMTGGSVTSNTAHNGAGLGLQNNSVTISGVNISDNIAANYGGGVQIYDGYLEIQGQSTISGNVALGVEGLARGGGVDTYNSYLYLSSSTVEDNSADGIINAVEAWGGGVYVGGGTTVQVTNMTFDANDATGGDDAGTALDGYGGGLYLSDSSSATINATSGQQTTFSNNIAAGHGDGAGLWSASYYVDISDTTFSGNIASCDGGGIYTGGATSALTLTEVTLTQNVADSDSNGMGDGGAISTDSEFHMTRGSISGNSGLNGGGLAIDGGTTTLNNVPINLNVAVNSGGGIYNAGGVAQINSSTNVEQNQANAGGGVYNTGSVTVNDSFIDNNTAATGGGLHNSGSGYFFADESRIENNSVTGLGGGAFNSATITLSEVDVRGNAATGDPAGSGLHHAGDLATIRGGSNAEDNIRVLSGATLNGNGDISGVTTVDPGGEVAPGFSPGILETGSIQFATGSVFSVELNGTTPGTSGHDQLDITGTVDLDSDSQGGATLSVDLNYAPSDIDRFVIINNDGIDPIVGQFAGLPDEAVFVVGGTPLAIDYQGGDGNDVVLTHAVDSDGDALFDANEVLDYDTDPNISDTDGDQLLDGEEVNDFGTDPLNEDTDGDQLFDGDEVQLVGTDPLNPDTDNDQLFDGEEVFTVGTDPLDPDTDGDQLLDGEEVNDFGTDPLNEDTDGDQLFDGDEVQLVGTDPLNPDTDFDQLLDGEEAAFGTDPLNEDTDGDQLFDGEEVQLVGTDPLNPDTDSDDLTDWEEVFTWGTDPTDQDTDDGGVSDGQEVNADGTDPLDFADDLTPKDYGDAPAPYPTLVSANGAQHQPVGPTLGSQRDAESDGQPAANADGDGADEDGVTIGLLTAGEVGAIATVDVTNDPGLLDAWIDFDGDGVWAASEQIANSVSVNGLNNTITFDVPSGAVGGNSYARFRLSTAGGLSPTGAATDGEVEDYLVEINTPPAIGFSPLTHLYEFDGSYADSQGGPALVPDGGTLGGGRYTFGPHQDLTLSSAFADPADYTVAMVIEYDSLTSVQGGSNWKKVIDFQQLSSDAGLYVQNDRLRFHDSNQPLPNGSTSIAANQDTHVVLTRSAATGEVKGYVDGVLQWTFDDSTFAAAIPAANEMVFFEDDRGNNEVQAGSTSCIAVYDGALNQSEVAELHSTSSCGNDTQFFADFNFTPTWLDANDGVNATIFQADYTLDSGLLFPGTRSDPFEKLFSASIAAAGDLAASQPHTVTVDIEYDPVSLNNGLGDNDLAIGLSDGDDVIMLTHQDQGGGKVYGAEADDGNPYVIDTDEQLDDTTPFPIQTPNRVTFDIVLGSVTTLTNVTINGTSLTDSYQPSRVIDATSGLSLVVFANEEDEAYRVNHVTVSIDSPAVDEGETVTKTGTFEDLDGDIVTIAATDAGSQSIGTVTLDPTTAASSGIWHWSYDTTDGPDENQTITLTADDGQAQDTAEFDLTVNNVVPHDLQVQVNPNPVDEGSSVTLVGTFVDPGILDTHTVVINWGDPDNSTESTFALDAINTLAVNDTFNSSTDSAVLTITAVDASTGSVGFSVEHQYPDDPTGTPNDDYTVSVKVTDDDGARSGVETPFAEDFEGLSDGNLIGQSGWTGDEMNLNSTTSNLGSRVIDGLNPIGNAPSNVATRSVNLAGANESIEMSFRAFATTNGIKSHNALAGLTNASHTGGLYWQNNTIGTAGWNFDPRQITGNSTVDFVAGGHDVPVDLQVVVDVDNLEVYGRYDFGSGLQETPRHDVAASAIAALSKILVAQDWGFRRGIEVDDIRVETHSKATATVTVDNVDPIVSIDDGGLPPSQQFDLTASIIDVAADLPPASIQWDVSFHGQPVGFNGQGTANIDFTPDQDGIYQVSLTVMDDDGGVGSQTANYLVDSLLPKVIGLESTDGTDIIATGVIPDGTTSILIDFNELVADAGSPNYQLQRAGNDALLGTPDDVIININGVIATNPDTSAVIEFEGLPEDIYRLTVLDAITDTAGNALDGDVDGLAGGNFTLDFVTLPGTSLSFSEPLPSTERAYNAVVADLDLDGWLDVAYASFGSATIYVNDQNGSFTGPTSINDGAVHDIASADFNEDGYPDLIGNTTAITDTYRITLSNGAGAFFPTQIRTGTRTGSSYSVITADFNEDNHADFAIAGHRAQVDVFFGDGNGNFPTRVELNTPSPISGPSSSAIHHVSVADVNDDDNVDIVTANFKNHQVSVFLGGGDGTFSAPATFDSSTTSVSNGGARYVSIGDVNVDGFQDLVVAEPWISGGPVGGVSVLLGDGTGLNFSSPNFYRTGGDNPYSVAIGDFNGDSHPDLVAANRGTNNVTIMPGDGTGAFPTSMVVASGVSSAHEVVVADFNRDLRDDILVSGSGNSRILLNETLFGKTMLAGPGGNTFDIDNFGFGAGHLIQGGESNPFDGLSRLRVNADDYTPFSASTVADNGVTIVTAPRYMSGLLTTREVTIPDAGGEDFARTVDVFENNEEVDVTTTVRIVGNLGSDANTEVFGTFSGDLGTTDLGDPGTYTDDATVILNTEQWIGTDDADGSGSPAIVHYIHGPNPSLNPSSVKVLGDNIEWTYDITVPAGETVRLAHYTILGNTRAEAIAAANALVTATGFEEQADAFLTQDELDSIANFQFATTEVRIDGNDLVIEDILGGDTDDTLSISRSGTNVRITDPNNLVRGGAGATQVDANTVDVPLSAFSASVVFDTLAGNDSITFDFAFDIGATRGVVVNDGGGGDVINWEATAQLATLDVTAETINLNSGTAATIGGQTYNGALLLGAGTTISAGDITFNGTVDGNGLNQAMAVNINNASGVAEFNGVVGGSDPPSSIKVNSAGGVVDINAAINVGTGGLDIDPPDFIYSVAPITSAGGNVNLAANLDVAISADVVANGNGSIDVDAGRSVYAFGNADITTEGPGAVDITAANTILFGPGVSIITETGDITLDANAGALPTGGVALSLFDTSLQTVRGAISLTANGGSGPGVEIGISLVDSTIASLADGAISMHGTGGAAGSGSSGVEISNSTVSSIDGPIAITGIGGGEALTNNNRGVILSTDATIQVTNGMLTVTGTAGVGNSSGVELTGGRLVSLGSGDVVVTAAGSGSDADLVSLGNSIIGDATHVGAGSAATGDITINADSIEWTGAMSVETDGALSIQPRTANATIGLGGGAGDLNLDDTELGFLQDGFSSIAISSGIAGDIDINTATFNDPLTLITGGSIHDQGGTDINMANGDTVTLVGTVAPGQSPGMLVVDGDITFDASDTFEVEVDGTAGPGVVGGHDQLRVLSNSRTITLNGAELNIVLNAAPPVGSQQVYTIVDAASNDSTRSGLFNFSGSPLNDGDEFTVGSTEFTINYLAGGDVILTESGNTPPTADAGGPYTVDEGSLLTLDGSGSSDAEDPNPTLTFEWDLDYDGVTFDVDQTGEQPQVTFPDDFPARTIALRVTDPLEESDLATTMLTVNNVAPTANADFDSVSEDGPAITIDVVQNDTDPVGPNDPLSITGVDTSGTIGLVGFTAGDVNVTYDPNGQFESLAVGETATDTFTYTIDDGDGGVAIGTVEVTITGVNDAPVAVADGVYNTDEDVTLNVLAAAGVLSNDSDVDGGDPTDTDGDGTPDWLDLDPGNALIDDSAGFNGLVAQLVDDVSSGTLTLNLDGSFSYAPDPDFNGSDSFTYQASDGLSLSSVTMVAITIDPVNDAPSFTIGPDQTVLEDSGPQTVGMQLAGSRVYWINNTIDTIQSSNLDGSDLTNIVSFPSGSNGMDLEVDFEGGKVYWSDSTGSFRISRADFDGSNAEVLVDNLAASGGIQLALDTANDKLYYTSRDVAGSNRHLNRMNLDGTGQEFLFEALSDPSKAGSFVFVADLEVDENAGQVYWTHTNGLDAIGRADVNGSNIEQIISPSDPGFSYRRIKLDVAASKVYWTANDFANSIHRADLDGANQETLLSGFGLAIGFDMDPSSGKMYWANGSNSDPTMEGSIQRSDLDGTNIETLIQDLNISSFGDLPGLALGLDPNGGSGGWATDILAGPPDEAGQTVTFVVTDNTNPSLFSAGPAISPDGVLTYTPAPNANGTATITVVLQDDGGTADGGVDTSPSQTFDIVVTPVNDAPSFTVGADQVVPEDSGPQTVGPQAGDSRVYWINNTTDTIQSSNLDGSDMQTVVSFGAFQAGNDVEVDQAGGKIYWSETRKIKRANLDGSNVEELLEVTPGIVTQLSLDRPASKLYYIERTGGDDTISRMNVDGSSNEALFDPHPTIHYGVAEIEVDPAAGKIYWTNTNGTDSIERANFDGTNREELISPPDPGYSYRRLRLDAAAGKMYWTANDFTNSIQRADLDGSNQELLVTGVGLALGFDVDVDAGKMYWANGSDSDPGMEGSIQRSDLDGTNMETLIQDLDIASFIDLPGLALGLNPNGGSGGWATDIIAGPPDEAGQTVTFVVTDNTNPSLFSAGPAISPDGVLTYTPAPNANGTATITVVLQDDGGTADGGVDTSPPQTFNITVTPVNDAPVAVADSNSTTENAAVTTDVLANDTDVDGDDNPSNFSLDAVSIASTTGLSGSPAAAGSVSIVGNQLQFDPGTDFDELDVGDIATVTIDYTMSDDSAAPSSSTLLITVGGENDAPVAVADSKSTTENASVTTDVLANDTDVDGDDNPSNFTLDAVSIASTTGLSGSPAVAGSVSIVGNQLPFNPGTDFDELNNGDTATVTVAYTMSDDSGASSSSTLVITVNGLNDDASISGDNAGDMTEDEAGDSGVMAVSDVDDGEDIFQPQTGSAGTYGTFDIDVAGNWTYIRTSNLDSMNAGDMLIDSFTVVSNDGTASETVEITINGVNDDPVANPDAASTMENTAIAVDVLTNDTDVDGDDNPTNFALDSIDSVVVNGLTIAPSLVTGSVTIVANEVSFDPGTDFDELDSSDTATITIDYTMRDDSGAPSSSTLLITVTGENDGPVAVVDSNSTTENASVTNDVLANDTDVDGDDDPSNFSLDSASIALTTGLSGSPAAAGSIDIVGNQLHFDPGTDFDELDASDVATVTIDYTMSDDSGASSSSTLLVTVTGENDGPVANPDTDSTTENAIVTTDVLANDTDVDGDDEPSNFTLDALSIASTSGLSGSPAAAGSVSIVGNQLQFDPGTDFDELDVGDLATVTIDYTMSDDSEAPSSSTLVITVTGENDDPVAVADANSTTENASVTTDVLANDTDVDDDPGNFSLDAVSIASTTSLSGSPAAAGSVSVVGNQLTFDPGTDFDELDAGDIATVTINYTMSDDEGASSSAALVVTVNGLNDDPVAVDDTVTTDENTAASKDVLANDTDIDGDDNPANFSLDTTDSVVVSGLSFGASLITGTVTEGTEGVIEFNPGTDFDELDAGDIATVTVGYTMSDDEGASSSAELVITVNGLNDNPVAVDDALTTDENTAASKDVLANDTDIDGDDNSTNFTLDSATIVSTTGLSVSPAVAGTANIVGNQLSFDPGTDFDELNNGDTATVTVGYTMSDDSGAPSSSTLVITVNGTNDLASISGDNAGDMTEDDAGDNGVMAVSDVDDGEDIFQPQAGAAGTYGTFNIDAAGNWTYNRTANLDSMNAGDILTDSFTATSSDGTASEQVTITINGLNDNASISGDNAGDMTEDDAGDSGVMAVSDVDDGEDIFQPQTGAAGTYGTFNIDAAGNWTYTRTSNLDSLNVGDILTDSFTAVSDDGTATELVTITITGVNDDASISGDNAGDMTEDDAGDSGVMAVSDVDDGEDIFQPQTGTAGTYGTFDIDAAGNWIYTRTANLDSMNAGDILTDSFTVVSDDGTANALVTININGLNDDPVAVDDTLITDENTAASKDVLANDTDVDGDDNPANFTLDTIDSVVVSGLSTGASLITGTVTEDTEGVLGFSPSTDFDELAVGESATVTVGYTMTDDEGASSSAELVITVNGVNDDPAVTGLNSDHDEPCNSAADGQVSIDGSFADVDLADTHIVTVNWGDGSSPETLAVDQLADTFDGSHAYPTGGVFEIIVTVDDGNGGTDSATTTAVIQGVGLIDGVLYIIGTERDDQIHVRQHSRHDEITVDARLGHHHHGHSDGGSDGGRDRHHRRRHYDRIRINFDADDVTKIVVHGCDGDDHIRIEGGGSDGRSDGGSDGGSDISIPTMLFGGAGRDHIRGSQGEDFIDGGEGRDYISSRRGDDTIVDLSGDNRIWSGAGDDTITTGDGDDQIYADGGNDTIDAGDGRNKVRSGHGDDIIITGSGNDDIRADKGNDLINAGDGNNKVYAGHGDDTIITGSGNDDIRADKGNDSINAGDGNNKVYAGHGDDTVITGSGRDRIYGDKGNDIILAGGGNDYIRAGHGDDIVNGGAGNDKIYGDKGDDLLIGGAGKDKMRGGHGDDLMIAGSTANDSNLASLEAALAEWTSGDLAGALVELGAITDDGDKDDLKGEQGNDHLIGGSGDKLKP